MGARWFEVTVVIVGLVALFGTLIVTFLSLLLAVG